MRKLFYIFLATMSFSHFAGEDKIKAPELMFREFQIAQEEGEVETQAEVIESYMNNLKHMQKIADNSKKESLVAEYMKRDNLISFYKKNKMLLEKYRSNPDLNPKERNIVIKSIIGNLEYLKPLIRLPAPPRLEKALMPDIEKVLNEAKLGFKNDDYKKISLLMCWPSEEGNEEITRRHVEWLTKNRQSMSNLFDQVLEDQSNWYVYEREGKKHVVLFPSRKDVDNLKDDVCIQLELISPQRWRLVKRMIFVWQAPLSEFFAIDKTDLK